MKIIYFLVGLLFSTIALAADTGVYSNMSINPESGDLVGTEITILFSRNGYWLLYQSAEGEPNDPVLLPIRVLDNEFSLKIEDGNQYQDLSFDGEFVENGLKVTLTNGAIFNSGNKSEVLPKSRSHWSQP